MAELKIHSDAAWNIASQWGWLLSSDTRTVAAKIDEALDAERRRCADVVRNFQGGGDSITAATMDRIFEDIALAVEKVDQD